MTAIRARLIAWLDHFLTSTGSYAVLVADIHH